MVINLAGSMRLPRTLRVLAMTLSNDISASYRWIWVLPSGALLRK
jgi:hypothetical protein